MSEFQTFEERRDHLRAELEILGDEDLQEIVVTCHEQLAIAEANDEGRDLFDDDLDEAGMTASHVLNEGREAMIEWIVDYEYPR